jgi:hypothetical protein
MARIVGADGEPIPLKGNRRRKTDRKDKSEAEGTSGEATQSDSTIGWLKDEIDTHERLSEKFLKRGRKIEKKYRDIRSPREDGAVRYNILWANTQTRLPALYARNPKPVVERRFSDRDPVGRVASEILERSIEYTLEQCNDLFYTMRLVVLDYELPGLGCVWVRYEPHFKKPDTPAAEDEPSNEGEKEDVPAQESAETQAEGSSVTDDVQPPPADEELTYEECKVDYLSWQDVGWSWARTWEEARLLWKRAYLDRDELTERFGGKGGLTREQIMRIPLDWSPKKLDDSQIKITRKKAIVYEIWDKHKRKRYWLVKNFPELLDERGDDLALQRFFAAPRPLMANAISDELMPTPNFAFYQDQANEIDELTGRIANITKALKVAGVRDASAEGLDRLLSEGVENELVPVLGWAAIKEKGGLAGVFELLPMKEIAETLGFLRDQRQQLIEDVYQLTGISDIVRGMSDPTETAAAQQLKGQFSMLRIQDQQYEVQRFVRDIVRIVGEIIAGYDIETLKQISGVKLLTNAEKAQLQAQLAQQQQMQAAQAAQQQAMQAAAHPPPPPGAAPPGAAPGAPGSLPHPAAPPGAGPAAGAPAGIPGAPIQPQPPVDPHARIAAAVEAALEHFKRPKQVKRDATGRIVEVA